MNREFSPSPVARSTALLAASLGACWAVWHATTPVRHPAGPRFDRLLTAGAAWVLLACAVWMLLICVAAVTEAASSGRLAVTGWVCPARVRTALLAGLGLVLAGGTPGTASAHPSPGDTVPPATPRAHTASLPVPERATGPAHPVDGLTSVRPHERVLVVRPGDTLWALASTRLPRSASPERICRQVVRLHHLNRQVIGSDPDLLRPGQRLLLPRTPPERLQVPRAAQSSEEEP